MRERARQSVFKIHPLPLPRWGAEHVLVLPPCSRSGSKTALQAARRPACGTLENRRFHTKSSDSVLYSLFEISHREGLTTGSGGQALRPAQPPSESYVRVAPHTAQASASLFEVDRGWRPGRHSIDPETIDGEFDIDPVIFAAGARPQPSEEPVQDAEASAARPLLTPIQHRHFVKKRFRQAERCRPRYTLEDGLYLVLDSEVQAALDVVRQVQRAERATRRDFVRNPRTYLRNALGDRLDEAVIEDLFVETAGYSNRVRDVGLWAPRVLPWLSREADRWFPDQQLGQAFGLAVGELIVPVAPQDLDDLRAEVARARGEENVPYREARIPATEETEKTLAELSRRRSPQDPGLPPVEGEESGTEPKRAGRQVLLIEENLDELGYRRRLPRRNDRGAEDEPIGIRTTLKAHQREGLRWLTEAWRAGAPGALLADDMGPGKTLQCLAFLEWLARVQQRAGEAKPFRMWTKSVSR